MIKIGYTHYWEIKKRPFFKSFSSALPDIEKVIEQHKQIIQFDSRNSMPPLVTKNLIRFNGIKLDSHDTFIFEFPTNTKDKELISYNNYYRHFCETGRQPYDIVVCKILLILKAHLGDDIILNSDGFLYEKVELDLNWNDAINDLRKMGYKIKRNYVPLSSTKELELEHLSIKEPQNDI